MSKKDLNNTISDKVIVKSRTYGDHLRAKRGSKTEAKLNDSLQQSCLDLQMANKAAQLIKAQLDPFRTNFKGGLIWNKLVKNFKKQHSLKQPFSVIGLSDTEIWELYPLSRFGAYYHVYTEINNGYIKLNLSSSRHPNFKRSFIDSYQISILVIFPDFHKMEAHTEVGVSDLIYNSSSPATVLFEIPIPPNYNQYLIILKLESTENGKLNDNVTVKGMKIISAGELK